MCTAVNYTNHSHYFGRNLDLEYSYQEEVVITPRNYPIILRSGKIMKTHYAMIGIATVSNDCPLYYDATNEHGVSIAGLNFPGNAYYFPIHNNKTNIAPFELIPYILGNCKNLKEVKAILDQISIADMSFSDKYPNTPLHWIIAYQNKSIVVEQTTSGLSVFENPVGILTNNPPFPYHIDHLADFMHLSAKDPDNLFSNRIHLSAYSRGMGAIGLPGDLSSSSRFVRAAFMLCKSIAPTDEHSSVSQFFHILDSVAMPRGSVLVNNKHEITIYSSCCNTDKGIYYYKTYDNSQISAVRLFSIDLNENKLLRYPLLKQETVLYQN